MAIARAQARSLLTDAEMALFGDSRNPALRSLTGRELTRRIDRVRKLRDKSRDQLQRQRLSSRERTGNKGGKSGVANERTARKSEVLDEVLQRFENRLHELERSEPSESARKSSTASARQRAAAGNPRDGAGKATRAARGPAVRKSTETSADAGKTAKAAAKKSAAPASGQRRKSAVTAGQALASTRELLEARRQRQSTPRRYPGDGDEGRPAPGYQSAQAKARALDLHAGEVRMDPIHGSISTRDRKNQAKRDRA